MPPAPAQAPTASGRRIAVVSRAGDSTGDATVAFVAHLGLEAVCVSQPGSGDGDFIQKLEALRDVGFAILLLAGEPDPTSAPLLEIGFLLGALGRGRMCLVVDAKQATSPSLAGVARHVMDDGGLWRLLLAREMKQAGLDVDLNRAL